MLQIIWQPVKIAFKMRKRLHNDDLGADSAEIEKWGGIDLPFVRALSFELS